jgi:enamine deaminase RidA (YjgF/YER057c/UK114 family)
MQRRDINAPDAPKPAGAYSQAVEVTGATRTLYISGQVGAEIDGTVPADVLAQARLAWASLIAQLAAAGMGLDHIVKLTTIIPDPADIPASRSARADILGERRPASTLIVGGLANPAWKIEIEAIAVA